MEVSITQLCLTLCNLMDCSLPDFSVHGILQQEYWSELPFSFPGYLPDPGIELGSPSLQADSLPTEPPYLFAKTKVDLGKEAMLMCIRARDSFR